MKTTAAALGLIAAGAAPAQAEDVDLSGLIMYGINNQSGSLGRYNFSTGAYQYVGPVSLGDTVTTGVNGSAYVPGFQNIFAFWKDPAAAQTRLLYVDVETAKASVIGQHMGSGAVTGAVAALISGDSRWVCQKREMLPLTGTIAINPNSSPDNEFTLITDTGLEYSQDDLHQDTTVSQSGTFYSGDATNLRIKPKGEGTQSVTFGGSVYELHNNVSYLFTGLFHAHIYNDDVDGSGKAVGDWHIAFLEGEVAIQEGETAANGEQWMVFALQNVEAEEDDNIDFEIIGDKVVPSEDFAMKVSVLGAAIVTSNYDMPVTCRVNVGGTDYEIFGDYDTALGGGNVNDDQNPRHYIFENTFPANSAITIDGRSWNKKKSRYTGNSESHWSKRMTVSTANSDSQQLIVLRNGDDVPDIGGYQGQDDLVDFIVDYIDADTDKVVLDENQAIYLYELGVTNINSSAADFQDLVVLITLDDDPVDLQDSDDDDSHNGAASRLLKVDHQTGGYEQIMTLDRVYDSLAWKSGQTFYAMTGNELYVLDPDAQTETLVDPVTRDQYHGLEFAGEYLMGFDSYVDTLSHIDHLTGSDDDVNQKSVSMSDLGTIVFMPAADDPSVRPEAFD